MCLYLFSILQALHMEKANSEEFDPQTPELVVIFMPEVVSS